MKFMLIMRATDEAKKAYETADIEQIINAMGAYNESLMQAGVLVAGEGLADDMGEAFVVDFSAGTPKVTDGPYGETRELFNGFWIIRTASKEEAIQWASRCPLGPGSKLEVRRVTEMSDFEDFSENEYLQKEAAWRKELNQP